MTRSTKAPELLSLRNFCKEILVNATIEVSSFFSHCSDHVWFNLSLSKQFLPLISKDAIFTHAGAQCLPFLHDAWATVPIQKALDIFPMPLPGCFAPSNPMPNVHVHLLHQLPLFTFSQLTFSVFNSAIIFLCFNQHCHILVLLFFVFFQSLICKHVTVNAGKILNHLRNMSMRHLGPATDKLLDALKKQNVQNLVQSNSLSRSTELVIPEQLMKFRCCSLHNTFKQAMSKAQKQSL